MLFLSVKNQFLPFIIYLLIIGAVMLVTGILLCSKCSAVCQFLLENNFEYKKLSTEQKALVVLPKWYTYLVRGFSVFLSVAGLAIIVSVILLQLT